MYIDTPLREQVPLAESVRKPSGSSGSGSTRSGRSRRATTRSSAAPGRARDRTAPGRDEHRSGVRAYPLLDGAQRMGFAGGEPRPADARAGHPGAAPRSSAASPPSSTIPAARVTDYIDCLRAVWNTFQTGARPNYEGRFYRFTLINDFFNPGPIDHPDIPVYLAGVNPRMAAAAGEVADGFSVHPHAFAEYLRKSSAPPSPRVHASVASWWMTSPGGELLRGEW